MARSGCAFPVRPDPLWLTASHCAEDAMLPTPKAALAQNTYAYESEPLVKPTGFREYDARWLLGKLPQARLEIVAGAAHAPFLGDPERFAELLIEHCHVCRSP